MVASKLHWRLLVATILALMAAAWIWPHVFRHVPGLQENRVLAQAPAWPTRLSEVHDFRKAADAYVADRFPARPYLIGALNRVRMIAGVSGSERVIVGRHGWLFFDDGTHLGAARGDPPLLRPEMRDWLMSFAGRTEFLAQRHIPYIVVTAPAKEVVYPQFGPAWYHGPSPDRATQLLPRLARQAQVGTVIDLYPALAQASDAGLLTYSLHDTHWNGDGAYVGYVALMTRLHAMGLTEGPLPKSAFVRTPGGQGDQPRDLALMLGVADKVKIDFPNVGNPKGEGRVNRAYLSDKQNRTAPQVVDTGETGKPTLMMLRDSFSNALLPMLYPHFSRIILAHNQDGTWRPDLMDRFKPDLVIGETIEHGLRVGMGGGPPASPQAVARIDQVLSQFVGSTAAGPTLKAPAGDQAQAVAKAQVTGNCNIEVADLTPGVDGEATFKVSGWISELGRQVTSPHGLVGLKGPAGVILAPVEIDKSRPDVAAYFKNPTAVSSGFTGAFFIPKLAAGSYTPVVWRRAGGGWIACSGKTSVTMP